MLKRRWWIGWILIALGLIMAAPAASSQENTGGDLLRLLRFAPDTPDTRQWLTYGDQAVWHASWNVPRIDNVADLEALDRDPRAYWMFILPRQTNTPSVLGAEYLLSDDLRGFYGFDLFNVDRFLEAGMPPNEVSVIEFSFDEAQIADALTATGYEAAPLDTGGTLYKILEDYQIDLPGSTGLPRIGTLGRLNRIALLDGQLVITRATDTVTGSLAAQMGDAPSLADDPVYIAAANALADPSLPGDLIGAILVDGDQFVTPESVGFGPAPVGSNDERAALLDQYRADPLPPYDLAVFATRHAPGATTLALLLVLPPDADPTAAAATLANRLQTYVSLVTRQPLAERWTSVSAASLRANNLPVAVALITIDDPPPAPEGERANAAIFDWISMIVRRDLGFLYVE
jgi:hypothetical protein